MQRNRLYRMCKVFLTLSLILIALIVALGAFLLSSERNLNKLSQTLISRMQSENPMFEVSAGDVSLGWNNWSAPAILSIANLRVYSSAYDAEILIPSAEAELQLWSLLLGNFNIRSLKLNKLQAGLHLGEENWYIVNGDGKLFYRMAMQETSGSTQSLLPFRSLRLTESHLILKDMQAGLLFDLANTNIAVTHKGNEMTASFDAALSFNEHKAKIAGNGNYDIPHDAISLDIQTSAFNPEWVCGIWLNCSQWPQLDMLLSGKIGVNLHQGKLDKTKMALSGESGVLAYNAYFPEPLEVTQLAFEGEFDVNEEALRLATFSAQFSNGAALALSGGGQWQQDRFALSLDAQAESLPVDDLAKFWPLGPADETREWVTTNITGGMATRASAKLRITSEESGQEQLPASVLEASVDVEGANVTYIDRFPPAKAVEVTLKFTANSLIADFKSGKLLSDTRIESGNLEIADFEAETVPMSVSLMLDSIPADVQHIMNKLPVDPLTSNRVSLARASGKAHATMDLALDLYEKEGVDAWDTLEYRIAGTARDVNNVTFADAIELRQIAGSYDISNEAAEFRFSGKYDEQPIALGYRKTGSDPALWNIDGTLGGDLLASFLPELKKYITGSLFTDLDIRSKQEGGIYLSGVVDAEKANIQIPSLGYHKPSGSPATLTLDTLSGNRTAFRLVGDDLLASGQFSLSMAEEMRLNFISFDTFRHARHDFQLSYRNSNDKPVIKLHGKSLDLAPMMDHQSDSDSLRLSQLTELELSLDLAQIFLPQEFKLTGVSGHLECHQRCRSAGLNARYGDDGAFAMQIYEAGGRRHFALDATEFGYLVHIFDINSRLFGGHAEISGIYRDGEAESPLEGHIVIKDFVVRDAPVLGKVLSMGSLTGLFNTLQGKGIAFDKFASDFIYTNDLLRLKNGKAAGSSMGVLIEGDINLATERLDVNGNLAPAYAINSFLGKIPLIGQVLVGGKGESVFAINYDVEGPLDNPQVMVNPLSALTPGFTRGFFDIFQSPRDTSDPQQPQPELPAKAPEKPEPAPLAQPTPLPAEELQWQIINP